MIHAVKSISNHGQYNHSVLCGIVNKKLVEAAALSDAATLCNPVQTGCDECFSKYVDGTCKLHVSSMGNTSVLSMSTAKSIR
jgi:hypothetical protein